MGLPIMLLCKLTAAAGVAGFSLTESDAPACNPIGGDGTCYVGAAISRLPELDAEACCAACAADAQGHCTAWEIRADQDNICVLKAGAPIPRPSGGSSGNCSASGTVGAAPPRPPSPGPPHPPSPPLPGRLAFDNMFVGGAVLQMNTEVAVWGWNAPNTAITLSLDDKVVAHANTTGGSEGNYTWSARLPPMPKSKDHILQVESGGQKDAVPVSFGIVILCSGQSNMGMNVGPGKFVADNGTAESAASERYAGKISLRLDSGPYGVAPGPVDKSEARRNHGTWYSPSNASLPSFSAVCWYSGRALYDNHLEATGTPLGLIVAAVGGSPIEYWMPPMPESEPPGYFNNPCETDYPQCDNGKNDTEFYHECLLRYIHKLVPYTLGGVIWDQAERDVKCPVALAAYPCMERYLISSWRELFASKFAFVGVQLAGYTAVMANGTGRYPSLTVTSEEVFTMRLQQEAGCKGVEGGCVVVPTYDFSCQTDNPAVMREHSCPYGSVHQPDKPAIGKRVALQLYKQLVNPSATAVVEGPRATRVTVPSQAAWAASNSVTVFFSGGSAPFTLRPTRNCTTCCDGSLNNGHTVDFDASLDGVQWVNGTDATLGPGSSITFKVPGLASPPTIVRHTAASIWPQCALYNAEQLPLFPFEMKVA